MKINRKKKSQDKPAQRKNSQEVRETNYFETSQVNEQTDRQTDRRTQRQVAFSHHSKGKHSSEP